MEIQRQKERALQHLHEGERLVVTLRDAIAQQKSEGQSTETTERLLQAMLTTLDRMRQCCR
jgi:hypothetical protein